MSGILRKPRVSGKIDNPYAKFNLTRNPFPPEGVVRVSSEDPVENGTVFGNSIRPTVLEKFQKRFILPDSLGKISPMGFLWSPGAEENRGLGKTSLLRYFQNAVNEDYGESLLGKRYKACVIYALPSEEHKSISLLCQLLVKRICDNDGSDSIFSDAISTVRYRAIHEIDELIAKKIKVSQLRLMAHPEFLEGLKIDGAKFRAKVVELLVKSGMRSEVAEFITDSTLWDYCRSLSSRKLQGEAPTIFFCDVVALLKAAYFTHAYIFIDDLYSIFLKASKSDVERFAEGLNHWQFRSQDSLNVKTRFHSFILTMHAKTQEQMAPFWRQAGLDQFAPLNLGSGHALQVDVLHRDEARQLVATYLNYAGKYRYKGVSYKGHRIDPTKTNKEPYSPFSLDAVDAIAEFSGDHPRKMLNDEFGAYKVLEAALAEGVDVIDKGFVDRTLSAKAKKTVQKEKEPSMLGY